MGFQWTLTKKGLVFMKNLFFSMIIILMSIIIQDPIIPVSKIVSLAEPSYAKWGRLAVEKAKERYPEAEIADYLYVGRRTRDQIVSETFKLWIKEADREFGVFIIIELDAESETVNRVEFIETLS